MHEEEKIFNRKEEQKGRFNELSKWNIHKCIVRSSKFIKEMLWICKLQLTKKILTCNKYNILQELKISYKVA